jgi:excisionase family DNA binding protein
MTRAESRAPTDGEDTLLTPSEAGRILGLTPDAVRALNNKGRLPAMKTLGGRRLFLRSDVDRLADERARLAAARAVPRLCP